MHDVYLSKSKYCKGKQCKKILWLDKHMPEEYEDKTKEDVLTNGRMIGDLAKGIFGEYIDIEYSEKLTEMIENTKLAMKNAPNIITEASFGYNNNFCSVDILKNDVDGVEIYEVKSSTEIKDIYLDDISYQAYILKNLGFNVKKACIVYVNNKYIRIGDLDLKQYFNIEDVTNIVNEKQEEVKEKIREIQEYMQNEEEQEEKIGEHCFKPYECGYWKHCTKNLPEKNIFDISLMQLRTKLKLYNKGIFNYEDLLDENINEKFKEQIEFELFDKEPKIEKEEIKKFLDELTYPLYFLDFESFNPAIPMYDYTKPYMQITFQYSLHYIEEEGGTLQHKEFLAKPDEDPRRELAKRLVEDIPENACIIVYNSTFEKTRLKELAEIYEDLSEKLLKMRDNIKDLMVPFRKRQYYTKEMEGSYSIKSVLPALFPDDPSLNYHNLEVVHNGGEAMDVFKSLGQKSKENQEKIRKALLKYCELDTFAMVKILEKLKAEVK